MGECADTDSTPLYMAAVAGDAARVRTLLAAGADPDEESQGPSDGTPLCGAACWGHEDSVRALLAAGADSNLPESDGYVPLQWAVLGMHHGTAAALLEAGADPNAACAPLVIAADRGSLGLVRLLLAHGADPGDGPVEVRREPRPGGCELVEVEQRWANGAQIAASEDGHAQIAALLRTM